MPRMNIHDHDLYFEDSHRPSAGDAAGAPIVFLHGLLLDHTTWAHQIEALQAHHRCIAYDHRGHGQSETPDTDFIDLETFYLDAVAVIDELAAAPCHIVGESMGGMVALRVAARRPELVRTLTVVGTTPKAQSDETTFRFKVLNLVARLFGPRPVVGQLLPILVSEQFREAPDRQSERQRLRELIEANDSTIHKAVTGVLNRPSITTELDRIRVPTQIIHGAEDRAVPIEEAERLAERIPRAEFHPVPETGHLVPLERPADTAATLERFIRHHAPRSDAGVGPGELRHPRR